MKLKQFSSFVTSVILATGILVSGGQVTHAVNPAAAEMTTMGQRAFQEVARCIESRDQFNILYVVDASSSLAQSDKEAMRAQVLEQSIGGLVGIAAKKSVNYALATFGTQFTIKRGWVPLNESSAQTERTWVQKNIPLLKNEAGTNWLLALTGASKAIAASPSSETSCQMIVWLTDGGIDMNSKSGDVQALKAICNTDPSTGNSGSGAAIVEDLRKRGVNLIAVLLKNEEALKALPDAARVEQLSKMSFLKSIAEGEGQANATWFGGTRDISFGCGTSPIPKNQAAGAYLEATDPIALLQKFMMIDAQIKGCASWGLAKDGKFTVEPGVAEFAAVIPTTDWRLTSPSGDMLADWNGPSGANQIDVQSEPGYSRITVKKSALTNVQWQGEWTIDSSIPNLRVEPFFCHGLSMSLGSLNLVAGKPAQISGRIFREDGSAVNLDDYSSRMLSVTALDPVTKEGKGIAVKIENSGAFSGSFTPIANASSVDFDLTLALTSKKNHPFSPLTRRFEVGVKDTSNFPSITPDVIKATDLNGRNAHATATVRLVPSAKNDGKVCFKKARVDQDPEPSRIKDYKFSKMPTGCVDLPAGSMPLTFPVEFSTSKAASGVVSISLPAELTAKGETGLIPQTATIQSNSIRRSDPPLWLFLSLLLLGLLVPIGIIYLLNYQGSRLHLRGIQVAPSIPVTLVIERDFARLVRRAAYGDENASGAGQLFKIEDWEYLPPGANAARSLNLGNGIRIDAKPPRNPFGVIEAIASSTGGSLIVSSDGMNDDGTTAPFSLNPAGKWLLQISAGAISLGRSPSQATGFDGVLTAFVDSRSGLLEQLGRDMTSSIGGSEALQLLGKWIPVQSGQGPGSSGGDPFSESGDSDLFRPTIPLPEVGPSTSFLPPSSSGGNSAGNSDDPFAGL